ncbi:hypothetical protein Lesp02_19780 [Lentzea sp. NBRC 105346]|uniref:hypothetical protein n=1 Tax=Lentzea sp. NBRC 105346 TaxID=3032205 RepID=UPI0024A3D4F7|nr:hypothetical protein [Lentzea sp. NBRC 105346]GLZ29788.1 hypothetical protein Lesp02_19780 [Lentzea sp. NBRC 105346]
MSVARLKLLPPELLPVDITGAARRLTRLGLDDRVLHSQDRVWVRAALAGDGLVGRCPVMGFMDETDETDERLGIVRVRGDDDAAVFLSGVLVAYLDVMDHMRPSSELLMAASALFDFALGRTTALRWDPGHPVYRGPAGDRLYCALTQALTFAVAGRCRGDCQGWDALAFTLARSARAAMQLCQDQPPFTRDHRHLMRLPGGDVAVTLGA